MDSSRTAGYEDSSGCETMIVHPTFDTNNNEQAIYNCDLKGTFQKYPERITRLINASQPIQDT
ncbi:AMP-binding enzyme [Musa troglodytarum]|uniref:AMP-binding enzyme n=1 Tax=Musa troglodytarum TaxID=320322 RepID=A0A9E7HAL1_9LILI|nr:AMP-binding enzyme [Musa troglodytarum]